MNNHRLFRENWGLRVFFFIVVGALALALMSAVVMWLWNFILPELTNLKPISYTKAMGLLLLCRILFGSFRKGGMRRHRGGFGPSRGIREKLMNMTEEERRQFKDEMRRRCSR